MLLPRVLFQSSEDLTARVLFIVFTLLPDEFVTLSKSRPVLLRLTVVYALELFTDLPPESIDVLPPVFTDELFTEREP